MVVYSINGEKWCYSSLDLALSRFTIKKSSKINVIEVVETNETTYDHLMCVEDNDKSLVKFFVIKQLVEILSIKEAIDRITKSGEMSSRVALKMAKFGNRSVLRLFITSSNDALKWSELYGSANVMRYKINNASDALQFSILTKFKYIDEHLKFILQNEWCCFHLARYQPQLRDELKKYINTEQCAYYYMQFFGIDENLQKMLGVKWILNFEKFVKPYPPSYTKWG